MHSNFTINKKLEGKKAALAYPFLPSENGRFRDGPAPDTVFIAHQSLWSQGAFVNILDTQLCQEKILVDQCFDFVFEISGFGTNVAGEGLLGSVAEANNIAYFPSMGLAQKIASDKLISKGFAAKACLRTPDTIVTRNQFVSSKRYIKKPICGGESQLIEEVTPSTVSLENLRDFFVEEYVEGVDATVLCFWNPISQKTDFIAAFENQDSTLSDITTNQTKKADHYIYGSTLRSRKSILTDLPVEIIENISSFLNSIGNPKISRLDFRKGTDNGDYYFLEINTDPTFGANQLWYEPIKTWSELNNLSSEFEVINALPIHPSAKALGFIIGLNHV